MSKNKIQKFTYLPNYMFKNKRKNSKHFTDSKYFIYGIRSYFENYTEIEIPWHDSLYENVIHIKKEL